MLWIRTTLAIALVSALGGVAAVSAADEGPLSIGITGSTPSEPTRNPTAILRPSEVQHLILDIGERPRSRVTCRQSSSMSSWGVFRSTGTGST